MAGSDLIALAEVADPGRPAPAGDRRIEVVGGRAARSRFDFVPGLRSFHGIDQDPPGAVTVRRGIIENDA